MVGRFVLLEDSALDAELIADVLAGGGIVADLVRVESEAGFRAAIESDAVRLILSDYSVPGFDGRVALRIARDRRPDVPFLFVSGAIGEEAAIETLHQGATDYVLKDRLQRLAPAVRRALREAEERRDRARIEAERERLVVELREALARVKLLSGLLPICSGCKRIRDERGDWKPIETYIQRHSEAEFSHGLCGDCATRLFPEVFEKK